MRALGALFLGLALTGSPLQAGLGGASLTGAPASVSAAQLFTVVLSVQNNGPSPVLGVGAQFGFSSTGFTPLLAAAAPASRDIPGFSNDSFTWTFSGSGCGAAQFTASAQGTLNGTPVASGVSNTYTVTLFCTPTPTPTPTPNFTATATPWIIYGTPTAVPSEGWAGIPGNLYHPLRDGNLQLQAVLPEAGKLSVELYDRLGRRVKTLEQDAGPGAVSLSWDGRGDNGLLASSGIYVARFKARGFSRIVKFAVIK